MKKLMKKLIIWLFEKYAMDYWINEQDKELRRDFKEKYKLQDDEIEEALINKSQEREREAYYAGKEDGYEKALKDNRF